MNAQPSPSDRKRKIVLSTPNDIVVPALRRSQKLVHSLLAKRNPAPRTVGSVFRDKQSLETLSNAVWREVADANVGAPHRVFAADIQGFRGILDFDERLFGKPCRMLRDTAADGQPYFVPVVQRPHIPWEATQMEFTTLILMPRSVDEARELVVVTFFPGPAVPTRNTKQHPEEKIVQVATIKQAYELGYRHARIETVYDREDVAVSE